MSFSLIPVRQNDSDFKIQASWFNTIRTRLIQSLGANSLYTIPSEQNITLGGEITIDGNAYQQLLRIGTSGGEVLASNIPFGATHGLVDGRVIVLTGTDDDDFVTIPFQDIDEGCIINGNASLKKYHQLTLIYLEAEKRFMELNRNF